MYILKPEKLLALVKKYKKTSVALGVLFFAFLGWKLFFASSQAETKVLASVEVRPAEVVKSLNATGIIKPEVGAIVKIGSRATGTIRRMYVRVGDTVTSGQVIAEIDNRELEAQVQEAQASLKRAQVEYDRIQATFPLQLKEAQAQVASAKASAAYAQLNYNRRKKLVEQDLDSRDSLDVANKQYIAEAQNLKAAEATLTRLKQEFTRQTESAVQSKVQAEASMTTARIRLSYSKILSPLDGVVSQVSAQEGETVVAGLQVANLITVLDPSRLEMWVYVDETDIGQVKPGVTVEFRVDSQPDKNFTGTVSRIYPEPEIKDSIVYYQTLVPLDKDTALQLRPEMTTQCNVIVDRRADVLSIPNEAVKWVNGRQVVFKVDDKGKATPVEVTFGMRGSNRSEVTGGLKEGEKVAVRLTLGSETASAGQSTAPAGPPRGGPRH